MGWGVLIHTKPLIVDVKYAHWPFEHIYYRMHMSWFH